MFEFHNLDIFASHHFSLSLFFFSFFLCQYDQKAQQQPLGGGGASESPETQNQKLENKAKPAAFIGRGRIKYDQAGGEGNRFIGNQDL